MATFVRSQEVDHEIGPSGRLTLRVTAPDVEMRGTEGGVARVRATFEIRAATADQADGALEHVSYSVTRGDGVLEVSEPRHAASPLGALAALLGAGFDAVATGVEVEVPRGAEVHVEGVSADLTATGLSGRQDYRTVSGDQVIDAVSGEVRVRGVSSDISLRAESALRLLEINTVSGDVSAIAPHIGQVRIVSVSGDVELEGALAAGAEHRVQTVSGDLGLGVVGDLTVEVRGISTDVDASLPHRQEGSGDRRRYVIGGGGPSLLFSSMSGDASIRSARRTQAHFAESRGSGDDRELEVLRALERGEIDVDEAAHRLGGASGV